MMLNDKKVDNGYVIEKDNESWLFIDSNDEEVINHIMKEIIQLGENYEQQLAIATIETKALAQVNEYLSNLISNLISEKLDNIDNLYMSKKLLEELTDTMEALATRLENIEDKKD